jgi:hypothetical protein
MMNQKLMDQFLHKAGAHFGGDGINYSGFEPSKFAQLIVAECAGQVDHILRERQAGGGTMGDDIREHFGVK